jgi:hypothetical protein
VISTSATRSEIAEAQSLPIVDLVNYQDGSVVSRVVLKGEKGNVTFFAFDAGQALTEHILPIRRARSGDRRRSRDYGRW